MQRRRFITLVGGSAFAWPHRAHAQQQAAPVIGYLHSGSSAAYVDQVGAFGQGLKQMGFVEGRNIAIEYRWADGHYDRLPGLAADLVGRNVAAIFAGGSALPAQAAKAATTTIPIVFEIGGDPVKGGLVAGMSRPDGNVTGVTRLSSTLGEKRLELLRELVQSNTRLALLYNLRGPTSVEEKDAVKAAARVRGIALSLLKASSGEAIDISLAELEREPAGGLCIATDSLFTSHRDRLVALAARHRVPTIYPAREFVASGGLVSYGTDLRDLMRQCGIYVGRVLRGASVADLPIVQAATFELVVNLKTAAELGHAIPHSLMAQVNEVVE